MPETFVSLTKANLRSSALTLDDICTKINLSDRHRKRSRSASKVSTSSYRELRVSGVPLPALDQKAPDQSRRVSKTRGKRVSLPGLAPPSAEGWWALHSSSVRGWVFMPFPFRNRITPSICLSVFIFPAHSHSFTAAFPQCLLQLTFLGLSHSTCFI